MGDVTLILNDPDQDDQTVLDRLLPVVYQELRAMAIQKLAHERPGHTLQATALVHEAYLRLVESETQSFKNRSYFFGAAAEAMRRILVENARRKQCYKHGGAHKRVDIQMDQLSTDPPSDDILAIDQALNALSEQDSVKADLVKLRYFAGLTIEQAALALDLSPRTAKRYWAYAKAWLYGRIHESSCGP